MYLAASIIGVVFWIILVASFCIFDSFNIEEKAMTLFHFYRIQARTPIVLLLALLCMSFARPDKEFKIFQFPKDQIPRIDGDFSDWDMVPDSYNIGLDELKNTVFGEGEELDPDDFDLNVKVGWVNGLNRLYFYIDAWDDYWDFSDRALRQDIFELVVDADLSGGPFIHQINPHLDKVPINEMYFRAHGSHAQNYHIFTPAKNKDWAMIWGNTPWIKEFPYANVAYDYDFLPGESGRLQMEFYITPFDHASFYGPAHSVISTLREGEIIGMSWAMLDFDGAQCESFMNLSHNFEMIRDASFLCAFRLMPLEAPFKRGIDADWRFVTENRQERIIRFYDQSVGEITQWHWDFGDGATSEEQNPVHQYNRSGEWTVVLTVEGPAGKSIRSKVWDVVTQ